MLICKNCGTNNSPNFTKCMKCGAWLDNPWAQPQPRRQAQQPQQRIQPQQQIQQPQQRIQPQQQIQQPQQRTQPQQQIQQPQQRIQPQQQIQQPQQYIQPQQPPRYYPPVNYGQLSMDWHNVLTNAVIFLICGVFAFFGFLLLTGSYYEVLFDTSKYFKETYYEVFEGMQLLDIGAGACFIAAAIGTLITRTSLAGYKANAIHSVNAMFSNLYVLPAAYLFISLIIREGTLEGYIEEYIETSEFMWALVQIICALVISVLNSSYYKKRQHMFVN